MTFTILPLDFLRFFMRSCFCISVTYALFQSDSALLFSFPRLCVDSAHGGSHAAAVASSPSFGVASAMSLLISSSLSILNFLSRSKQGLRMP